jgi:hypothetical protein
MEEIVLEMFCFSVSSVTAWPKKGNTLLQDEPEGSSPGAAKQGVQENVLLQMALGRGESRGQRR